MFFHVEWAEGYGRAGAEAIARAGACGLGDVVRGQVVRGYDSPPTWHATMNGSDLGKHPTREEAIRRVEEKVANEMRDAVRDWSIFQAQPKRPVR
jgi:hypothetical protein